MKQYLQQLRKHQALLACLCGLALTRVWLQGMLFGFYAHSDAGFSTTINQWSYGGAILIGAIIAWKRPRGTLEASVMAWMAFSLGTIAGIVVFLTAQTPSLYVHGITMVLCGVAGAMLGGMWVLPFVQLNLRSALIGSFCALGLGSALAWMLAFANDTTVMTLCLLIPSINLLLFRQLENVQSAQPQVIQDMRTVTGDSHYTHTHQQAVYDNEPLSSLLLIYGGVIVLSLALGIARGYPFGTPLPMDVLARCVHQGGVVLLSACIVIKLLIRSKSLSFLWLWRCEVLVLLLGAASIVVLDNNHVDISIAVINIADTFMLGVLWAISQDVARFSSFHPFAIFGFIWAARVLARNVARVLIFFIGGEGIHYNLALGAIVVSLAIGMAFLLTDKLPRQRPLFSDNHKNNQSHWYNNAPETNSVCNACEITARTPATHEVLPPKAVPSTDATHATPMQETKVSTSTQDTQVLTLLASSPERMQAEAQKIAQTNDTEQTHTEQNIHNKLDKAIKQHLEKRYQLTDRESEVILWLALGYSKSSIGERLFVSENTVRTHVRKAYTKLGIHSKTQLAQLLERIKADYTTHKG